MLQDAVMLAAEHQTSPMIVPRSEAAQLLTAAQLAERWQVPRSQIYNLTTSGRLPVVRLGRYKRYAVADIETFERGGGAA